MRDVDENWPDKCLIVWTVFIKLNRLEHTQVENELNAWSGHFLNMQSIKMSAGCLRSFFLPNWIHTFCEREKNHKLSAKAIDENRIKHFRIVKNVWRSSMNKSRSQCVFFVYLIYWVYSFVDFCWVFPAAIQSKYMHRKKKFWSNCVLLVKWKINDCVLT